MLKVIRQEKATQPYPRGIIETEWPLLDWLQSKNSILAKGTNDDEEDKLGFAGRGETWKRLRIFLQTDLLSPQAAAGYIPAMVKAANFASKVAPSSADALNAYANRCSFDLFNSLMFGQLTKTACIDTCEDEENNLQFCTSTAKGMDDLFMQMTSPAQVILFQLGIKTSMYKDMADSFDTVFSIAEQRVQSFRQRSESNELTDEEKNSYLSRAIARQKEEKDNISETDLMELVKIALTAAIDTTSSVMKWNMMHLALNLDVQERLHAELVESTMKHGGLNAEVLRKVNVPYLHAVIRETHRITPAAPLTVFKETLADVEIHGTNIKKGSVVVLDAYSVGMDIVDKPNEFRPERWLPNEVEARKGTNQSLLDHPFYREPFSQGSRKCPGSRVASNEVLIMISQLVLDWKISVPEGFTRDDVTYRMHGMVHPDLPRLSFEPR